MDGILMSLELQVLIENFRKENVDPDQLLCLSDTELEKLGVKTAADRSQLRKQCRDYFKSKQENQMTTQTKEMETVITSEKDEVTDIVIRNMEEAGIITEGNGENILAELKLHINKVLNTNEFKSLINFFKKHKITLSITEWVSYAEELFQKTFVSDRPALLLSGIVVVIVIIVAVQGKAACNIIPPFIEMCLKKVKALVLPLSIGILKESMALFLKGFPNKASD